MHLSGEQAIYLAQDLTAAGKTAVRRNSRKGNHWEIIVEDADDNPVVTLHGEIREEISVFTQQRQRLDNFTKAPLFQEFEF